MRQADLARVTGLDPRHINKMLASATGRGKSLRPEEETVHLIAAGLEWPLEDALRAAGYAAPEKAETDDLPEEVKAIGLIYGKLGPQQIRIARPLLIAIRQALSELQAEGERESGTA